MMVEEAVEAAEVVLLDDLDFFFFFFDGPMPPVEAR